MGRKSRDKGIRAERDVIAWLNRVGFPNAERRGLGFEASDVIGIPGVTIEIKDAARTELAAWVDQLEDELDADRNDIGAVIAKRRRKGNPADWYAICPAYIFARLLIEAGYGHMTTDDMIAAAGLDADNPAHRSIARAFSDDSDLSGPADNKGNSRSLGRTRPNRKNQQP